MKDMNDTPAWVLSLFDELNARHFGGKLDRPSITIQEGAMRTKNAWYIYAPHIKAAIPVIGIGLTREVLSKGREYTADTLLHEMVHHALATVYKEDHMTHGDRFCAIANAIGATLGLRAVAPNTVDAECWPQSARHS